MTIFGVDAGHIWSVWFRKFRVLTGLEGVRDQTKSGVPVRTGDAGVERDRRRADVDVVDFGDRSRFSRRRHTRCSRHRQERIWRIIRDRYQRGRRLQYPGGRSRTL